MQLKSNSQSSPNSSSESTTSPIHLDDASPEEIQEAELLLTEIKSRKTTFTLKEKLVRLSFCSLAGFVYLNVGVEALNSFFGSFSCGGGNKAYNSEAKQYTGSLNRGQQAYFVETQKFASSVEETGIGIKNQTARFNYSTEATPTAVFNYAIPRTDATTSENFGLISWKVSVSDRLKSYVGAVFLIPDANTKEKTTVAITCESSKPGMEKLPQPTLENGVPTCPSNTIKLNF